MKLIMAMKQPILFFIRIKFYYHTAHRRNIHRVFQRAALAVLVHYAKEMPMKMQRVMRHCSQAVERKTGAVATVARAVAAEAMAMRPARLRDFFRMLRGVWVLWTRPPRSNQDLAGCPQRHWSKRRVASWRRRQGRTNVPSLSNVPKGHSVRLTVQFY